MPQIICQTEDVIKTAITIGLGFAMIVSVIYRFYVLVIIQSMPSFEEDFFSLFLTITFGFFSLVLAFIKQMSEGRPVTNEVIFLGIICVGRKTIAIFLHSDFVYG